MPKHSLRVLEMSDECLGARCCSASHEVVVYFHYPFLATHGYVFAIGADLKVHALQICDPIDFLVELQLAERNAIEFEFR